MARKYQDKSWLERKYWQERKNTREIANEVGVVRETIRRWLVRHDIPRRKRGPEEGVEYSDTSKLQDKDWLERQYAELERPSTEIANELGLGDQTVLNWLHRHDIDVRSPGDVFHRSTSGKHKLLDDPDWLLQEYAEKERSMSDIARQLGVTPPAIKYRLDEYGIERRESGWVGGGDTTFQRDPNWEKRREHRIKRDNYTCQDCGVHQDDYYRSLDVHHIEPRDEFVQEDGSVDWAAANSIENTISLCQSCHVTRHRN